MALVSDVSLLRDNFEPIHHIETFIRNPSEILYNNLFFKLIRVLTVIKSTLVNFYYGCEFYSNNIYNQLGNERCKFEIIIDACVICIIKE